MRHSVAVCPSSLSWLMWVCSSFRVCVSVTRPAVPSLRLIDESVTFRQTDRERNIRSRRHARLSSSPAGGPVTPKRQQSAFCSEEVIIKRGENTDFSFLFPCLKSDNQALQLSRRRPHLRGRKQPALLHLQQPTVETSQRPLSRVHVRLSRGGPAGGQKDQH